MEAVGEAAEVAREAAAARATIEGGEGEEEAEDGPFMP